MNQKEEPVDRVGGANDLTQEWLPAPQVRIPERELVITPGGPLKLQAGHIHVDDIGVIDPGEFVGECQSPAKGTADYGQDRGGGTGASQSANAYRKPPWPPGKRMSDHLIFQL